MQNSQMQVLKLVPNAIIPTRGSAFAAGLDLYSSEAKVVPRASRALVKTGIALAIPPNHYGRIAPRSGLALNSGIDVGAGVIDSDYRGEVAVLLFNFGENDFLVAEGMRIAQLIIEQIMIPTLVEVENLSDTCRGAGGFGSTGVN
jgi:dUTP pyrophosphatase